MAIKNNQIELPFTSADKAKLDAVEPNAKTYSVATQEEAEAGTDNLKLMTPLRVSQAIEALANGGGGGSTAVTGIFTNGSGSSISALTLVQQDASGDISAIDPSQESHVVNILGVLLDSTADAATGSVALSGLVKEVTTSFSVGDVLYLSKTGGLTTTVPEIGAASFVAGDFVVKVGRILKNSDNPSNKDLKLEVELIGQL